MLCVVANGQAGLQLGESGFAANGFGDHSPGGYSLLSALVIEVVLTMFFLYVILGVHRQPGAAAASRRSRSACR